MNFLVAWSETAFEQMQVLLNELPARRAEFAASLRRIAAALRTDPISQGESREGADRIFFVDELTVIYEVDEESTAVEVLSIHLNRPKRT